ncbi:hypothetical protein [Metabacillus halosaccharovorans]|uniref:hypothetical protein n=1 Tax=Metabacillus halosaccharovorans TaxID=930124 RepID=UPI000995011D|nr:hypothetical protein [Metabacillus halosaccharovorans]
MRKYYLLLLSFAIIIISGCGYNGEYVRWGDTVPVVNTDRLEKNNIPYKIKDNKVYIPEDAFDKAIFCCS